MPRRTMRQWRLCPSDAGTLSYKLFVFKEISSRKAKSRRCEDTDNQFLKVHALDLNYGDRGFVYHVPDGYKPLEAHTTSASQ
jgi:hypothetical protein